MTDAEAVEPLCAFIAPWLRNAHVDGCLINRKCACFSDVTMDPPRFEVTFEAQWAATEQHLAKIVSALEAPVKAWALTHFEFTGCNNCRATNNPSVWVRVIPKKDQ